jgi:hypothetical protein
MGKSGFVVAVIAATCSSMAFAGEVKQDKKAPVPSVKATTMSDADMDKVTAGAPSIDNNGANGGGRGFSGNDVGRGWERNNANGRF